MFGNVLAPSAGWPTSRASVQIAEAINAQAIDAPTRCASWARRSNGRAPSGAPTCSATGKIFRGSTTTAACWPFVGGFWVLLLARLGWERQAWEALEQLAAANQVDDWAFNEWFHGQTGEPQGMPGQSWNAALYVLAYRTLVSKKQPFRLDRLPSGPVSPIGLIQP